MMKNSHNLNSLKRWSCKPKELPDVNTVKSIHVYDFDNTLFSSPLPNPQLWHPSSIGLLHTYEVFAHGGWWHDPSILSSTGEGIEVEEPRAWEGWWNEVVASLAEQSIQEKDAVTIMLTGRGEGSFADLVNRIVDSKKLDFDMVVLKPEVGPNQQQFQSTMDFKQAFLRDLCLTYKLADNIRIYEDRPKHVKGFRDWFERFNKSLLSHPNDQPPPDRKPITAEVIHVCELKSNLDPQSETIAVQTAINSHNKLVKKGAILPSGAPPRFFALKEHFLYFGYLISQTDSARLITLCNTPAHLIDSGEVKYMASSILIAPFFPRKDLLEKVGGRGNKVTWQVNGVAKFEDRIWAARVTPIGDKQIHTQDDTPMVVLAIRKGSRQIDAQRIKNWQPVGAEKQFIFETVVGDKIMLKIEEVDENSVHSNGKYHGHSNKRKFDTREKEAQDASDNYTSNKNGGGGRYFNKSKANFNNKKNSNFSNSNHNFQNQQANTARQRNVPNGPKQRGNNRGPGYKSLDDFSQLDGTSDSQTMANGGATVMNY